MTLQKFRAELKALGSPEGAKTAQWFFKTGPGQYGEGDIFLGIKVPVLRTACKKALDLSFVDLQILLDSALHEERLAALIILCAQFAKTKDPHCVDFYLKNTHRINNWDLVDASAPNILGLYLLTHDPKILYELVQSSLLWERRIAVVSTYTFIRQNQFQHTLALAEILSKDTHDLMHKAVGWMLREVGKRDQKVLEDFLQKNAAKLPRTALRYAIERFPEPVRKKYLTIKKYE